MKVILFLAAIYSLIINQCYRKTAVSHPRENANRMLARDSAYQSSRSGNRFPINTVFSSNYTTAGASPLVRNY